jgi:peptidoglycan/xylan/chitin deacetylase (PgdA/CDA1 family)
VKDAVEAVLVRGGVAQLARRFRRNRTLVLAYHNIVPQGEPVSGDRSLHLSQEQFAEQLDLLCRLCDVIPLDAVLEPGDPTGRPRVAITFDDAYRGTVTAGVQELVCRGLPATIFVVPAFVGGRSFWWDEYLTDLGNGTDKLRQRALAELAGSDHDIRGWAEEHGVLPQRQPDHAVVATEDELQEATRLGAIVLGSHTWSHPNLAQLDSASLEEELTSSIRWLERRFERVVPWLAYPYGVASPTVERAAADAGYRGAFYVSGGWLPKTIPNAHALPRLNVPAGVSAHGFALRLSGLLGG